MRALAAGNGQLSVKVVHRRVLEALPPAPARSREEPGRSVPSTTRPQLASSGESQQQAPGGLHPPTIGHPRPPGRVPCALIVRVHQGRLRLGGDGADRGAVEARALGAELVSVSGRWKSTCIVEPQRDESKRDGLYSGREGTLSAYMSHPHR